MNTTKKLLAQAVKTSLDAIKPDNGMTTEQITELFEYPPDASLGDIALPCFKLSRALRAAPPVIAAKLADAVKLPFVSEVSVAGGYLNIKLDRVEFFRALTSDIENHGASYGSDSSGCGKTVILDYSSPNVAKPFHIGHLGTTVIGHSLKKIHAFEGYNCIGVNHLGDWGTQFGKLTVAYRKWGSRELVEEKGIDELVALYVRFHAEAEKDDALNDEARVTFTALEHGDPEITALWKWFIDISIKEYKKTYRQLDIEFDYYTGESFYVDKIPGVVEKLREKELLTVDDGATIVNLEDYKMPPCIIYKSDGSTIYHTRDIAAALYRKETFDFDKCIYVTSAGQCLHFAQLFKVIELMGYDWYDRLVHVPYGTVSLNGEKLATRTGNVVLLKDLFATAVEKAADIMKTKNPALAGREDIAEAVGVGAVVFYYLSANRMHDINFVLEDALNFDGNTGPYAQYTYARTCAILAKAGDFNASADNTLCTEEFELCKTLSLFPETVSAAARQYEPSVITRYILDLCAGFNRFYQACSVLNAENEDIKNRRLHIVKCVNTVLGTALDLICVRHPEKI